MEDKITLVDTSILINYYRKTDKANSDWVKLVRQGYKFSISAVTKYEIYSGATKSQLDFWKNVLQAIEVIPFDEACVNTAVAVNEALKRKRKQIGIADLFIGSTALTHNLPISTINKNHFDRIDGLEIIDVE
jgi:tRNA(fMet)-specific endonuclease VapC